MRGKRSGWRTNPTASRIIPAHAGQTTNDVTFASRDTDHPRACGANGAGGQGQGRERGSSPRMRGKRVRPARERRAGRIIPAHAGQTRWGWPVVGAWSDHPRACGANLADGFRPVVDAGSSPRMRGKLIDVAAMDGEVRIIPAHAGQTGFGVGAIIFHPDHPRACGANL